MGRFPWENATREAEIDAKFQAYWDSSTVAQQATPYPLHPTPCTLHPAPYTLHPNHLAEVLGDAISLFEQNLPHLWAVGGGEWTIPPWRSRFRSSSPCSPHSSTHRPQPSRSSDVKFRILGFGFRELLDLDTRVFQPLFLLLSLELTLEHSP